MWRWWCVIVYTHRRTHWRSERPISQSLPMFTSFTLTEIISFNQNRNHEGWGEPHLSQCVWTPGGGNSCMLCSRRRGSNKWAGQAVEIFRQALKIFDQWGYNLGAQYCNFDPNFSQNVAFRDNFFRQKDFPTIIFRRRKIEGVGVANVPSPPSFFARRFRPRHHCTYFIERGSVSGIVW